MNTKALLSALAVTVVGFGASPALHAQDVAIQPRASNVTTTAPQPKKSPMNSTSLRTKDGYARIVYSQPMLRGRDMLGDKVPYGKVWRFGANEATEIFLTEELEINGETEIPAGAYAIFCIPGEDSWTLIFSESLGEWGAYNYDESEDVARVTLPVTEGDNAFEAFTIYFEEVAGEEQDKLVMAWGGSRVEAMVEVDD